MNRQRIVLLLVPLLLAGLLFSFKATRPAPSSSVSVVLKERAHSSSQTPSAAQEIETPSIQKVEIPRDPFQVPAVIQDVIQKRQEEQRLRKEAEEEARRKAEEERQRPQFPEQASPTPPPSLKLQGILWRTREPAAIINRKVVRVGDSVEKARVIRIAGEGVTIRFEGQEFTLSLPQETKKEQTDQRGGSSSGPYGPAPSGFGYGG